MRGFRKGLALVAIAAGLVIGPAACGGGSGGNSGGEPTLYQNAIYGFDLTYDKPPLSQTKSSTVGSEKYAVAFADKDGPELDDAYANGVRVAVSELDASLKPKQVREMKADMAKILEGVVSENGGEQIGEVAFTEVNGTPGFRVEFTFPQSGKTLRGRVTFLFHDRYLFDFTEQTMADDWDSLSPTLAAVVQSFTLD